MYNDTLQSYSDSSKTTDMVIMTLISWQQHFHNQLLLKSRYIMPSVCLFGILGNTINLTILTRRPMRRSSPYTYLLGLAVTDMTVLSLSLVDFIISSALHSTSYWSVMFNAFVFYPISNIFTSSSVWITVLLTVERLVNLSFLYLEQFLVIFLANAKKYFETTANDHSNFISISSD